MSNIDRILNGDKEALVVELATIATWARNLSGQEWHNITHDSNGGLNGVIGRIVENNVSKEGMSFGEAIEATKQGKKIARSGWNGKGMFLYHVPAAAYPPSTEVAKEAFGGENVPYGAYIAMKTAQGNVVPWLASQTDMLANDWYIVE